MPLFISLLVLYITLPLLHEKRKNNIFGSCSLTTLASCTIVLRVSLADNASCKNFAPSSQSDSKRGAILRSPGKQGKAKVVSLPNSCTVQVQNRLPTTLSLSILALITKSACYET